MRSLKRGKNISRPEITNISPHGFWILFNEKEYLVAFEQFPWFKNANISQITDLELLHGTHLYWPQLDIDLSLEIIEHPEKYTLISK